MENIWNCRQNICAEIYVGEPVPLSSFFSELDSYNDAFNVLNIAQL